MNNSDAIVKLLAELVHQRDQAREQAAAVKRQLQTALIESDKREAALKRELQEAQTKLRQLQG